MCSSYLSILEKSDTKFQIGLSRMHIGKGATTYASNLKITLEYNENGSLTLEIHVNYPASASW